MRLKVCNSKEIFTVKRFNKKKDKRDVRVVVEYKNSRYVGFLRRNYVSIVYKQHFGVRIDEPDVKVYRITGTKYTV